MKPLYPILFVLLMIVGTVICVPRIVVSQEQPVQQHTASMSAQHAESDLLEIAYGAVCRNVVQHEPVGVDTSFPMSVDRLYCFTKVTGAAKPTEITHIWYHGAKERARVSLAVRSASWRTYSSKLIMSNEVGEWHVDVVDAEGNFLASLPFVVIPVRE